MKAERVADRDDQLADPQPARIAELGKGRGLAIEPQHREVGVGIVAELIRRQLRPSGKVAWILRAPLTTWLLVST